MLDILNMTLFVQVRPSTARTATKESRWWTSCHVYHTCPSYTLLGPYCHRFVFTIHQELTRQNEPILQNSTTFILSVHTSLHLFTYITSSITRPQNYLRNWPPRNLTPFSTRLQSVLDEVAHQVFKSLFIHVIRIGLSWVVSGLDWKSITVTQCSNAKNDIYLFQLVCMCRKWRTIPSRVLHVGGHWLVWIDKIAKQQKMDLLSWKVCIFVFVCLYVYMSVCLYVCVSIYATKYVCTYACMHVCMYACMYVCDMYARMHVCVYVCFYVCMFVCMYVWCMHANKHVCMYVCMFAGK